jgi:hypothetical protein
MRPFRSLLCLIFALALLTTIGLSTICLAEAPDRIAATIDSGKMVALKGQVQRAAKPQYDQGRVDSSFQLSHVTLLTVPTPSQQKALSQLLAEQQNPKSPNFHKWLTPEQYADRFGLSRNDVKKASAWLKSQGLTVDSVARGRNWIVFSGSASQIESVFRTEIHRYNVNGEKHFANTTPPSIPTALAGIAAGFRGLDDFRPKPRVRKAAPRARNVRPDYYDGNTGLTDFLAPNDIATIYDLGPLYTAGFDGTGEKLVIVGQTDVFLADLNAFRNGFGLTAISGCTTSTTAPIGVITSCTASDSANFQYVLDGTDPGVSQGDLSEADLDLEWSAATARGAQIIFVNSTNVFTSYYYAIDNLLAPVISMSYGICEFGDNSIIDPTTGLPGADEVELMKANSLGITFLNSSGDSGAAGCDPLPADVNNIATGGLAAGYPASSPEVTGVGGTAIVYPTGFTSTYWGTNDTTNNGGTAQNPPLPEIGWNDDVELPVAGFGGTALTWQESYAIVQSGGGPSNCAKQDTGFSTCVSGFPQPAWQAVTVPSQASARFTPDVSLLASPNFPGYVYCTPVEELATGTTDDTDTASSCATSIAAAVNGVTTGTPPNVTYVVNPSIVGGTSASAPVFAGIVTLLNQFLNGASSPGLGNINPALYTLAATPTNNFFHQVTSGNNMVYCLGGTPAGMPATATYQCPATSPNMGIFGFDASNADATTGYNLVTGLGSVDANNLFIAWKALRSGPGATTTTVLAASTSQIYQTGSVTLTATVTPSTAVGPVTFSNGATVIGTVPLTGGVAILSTATLPIGANSITASYGGNATLLNSASTPATTVTVVQAFTMAPGAASYTVTAGQSVAATVALTLATGFTSTLTFTCTDPAPQSICTGPTLATNKSPVTFNITTTAPTALLYPPLERGSRIFYAALLPGLLGIVLAAGSRKRAVRGIRLMSLILVLGFSTLWMGSCSSGNSVSNPGTPKGPYSITVNATSGGSTPATAQTTINLVVQ